MEDNSDVTNESIAPIDSNPIVSPPATPQETQLLTPGTAAAQEIIQQQASTLDYALVKLSIYGLILTIFLPIVSVVLLVLFSATALGDLVALLTISGTAAGALATMAVRPPLTVTATKTRDQ